MEKNMWVLKSVQEDARASQTIDSYEDNVSEYYNFDNFVANSQQLCADDIAVIINKNEILGVTRISKIIISEGTKTIRRCPLCSTTTIDVRKQKRPIYRCNKGHEFSKLIEEVKKVKKYKAIYSNYISVKENLYDLKQLRPHYINGYNQNMSIQKLSFDALDLFGDIRKKFDKELNMLLCYQGLNTQEYDKYIQTENDERELVLKAIKIRRGQQNFRKQLLQAYNSTCIITGCKIVDLLEAAHINPYRGIKDNHLSNGLLLRADIHTLFDLNLIAINPNSLEVEISHQLLSSEYNIFNKRKIKKDKIKWISCDLLERKYQFFQASNIK